MIKWSSSDKSTQNIYIRNEMWGLLGKLKSVERKRIQKDLTRYLLYLTEYPKYNRLIKVETFLMI